jgi:hypothetical protein
VKPTGISTNELQLKWWRCRGVVYFMAAGSPPAAVKIGVTTRDTLIQRLRAVQSSNHETIELLGAIPFETGELPLKDAEDQERWLHIQFGHLQRFKASTRGAEWFTATSDLLGYIAEKATSPEQLGVPRVVSTPINR